MSKLKTFSEILYLIEDYNFQFSNIHTCAYYIIYIINVSFEYSNYCIVSLVFVFVYTGSQW